MTAIVVLLTLLVTAPAAAAATDLVVIGGRKLQPPHVTTTVGQPLVFVNRSGSQVDVDFVGSSEGHRIAQPNGSIVAVVREPGRHPFVVRFGGDRRRHLHGVVEALDAPGASKGLPICGEVPPGDVCIPE